VSLSDFELKALAVEFAAAMPDPAREVVLILSTGEQFSREAMELARLYDAAVPAQRLALDAIARAFNEPGESR
jgi:hypothetical protein